ncbi:MAG: 4-vinyl reductase [Desulfarculales bacterium]|jgi:predicted hydrocarbon binding protein|nr:4-vinyl reductase [Desulfarculales bacterium]
MRKYEFDWKMILTENIEDSRPHLGPTTRLENYRLMQFTLRDILEQRYGSDQTDDIFRAAGRMAGKHLYENLLSDVKEFGELVNRLQALLEEMSIGILRLEKMDMEAGRFILTVGEDLDCSGLPETGNDVCVYDEGFIAGILEAFTGKKFEVKEIDCWCTGERTCRFQADML